MKRALLILALMAAGCSESAPKDVPERQARIPLDTAKQDARCRENIANGLAPGLFDYGVVNSPDVAKAVATTYIRAILRGDKALESTLKRPMQTTLKNGVWHVRTTLPKGALGLYEYVDICQSNGRVLTLSGGQ